MATPRRSSRLERKAEEKLGRAKQWRCKRALVVMDEDEEEEEEDNADVEGAVIVGERAKNKTNDFVKVLVVSSGALLPVCFTPFFIPITAFSHSSYNADKGLDCYEFDFIDDEDDGGGGGGSEVDKSSGPEEQLTPTRTQKMRGASMNSMGGRNLLVCVCVDNK